MTKTNRFRIFMALAAVAALVAVLTIHSPASAQSKGITFIVNLTGDAADVNTADDECDTDPVTANKQCTLRAAIEQANATPGANTINFNIPESVDPGVKTISPTSQLPAITDPVTIDGYTQAGATFNTETQPGKTNANLLIELDGTNAGNTTRGLLIGSNASNTVIKGLVINRFKSQGILINGNSPGVKIEGNFIGTNAAGDADQGNSSDGVFFSGPDGNTIGGQTPDKRNLISGNGGPGVRLSFSSGNEVESNLIGTNKDGTGDLGNTREGVDITAGASGNTVGDDNPSDGATNAANTIAFNGLDGAFVDSGTGNRILSNFIFSNDGLGIDLSGGTEDANDVTANDKKDPDTGPNNLQNFPVISSTTTSSTSTTTIKGKLNSRPRKAFTIQFFSSPQADPSGFGEGKTFLGQTTVKTSRKGIRSFSFVPAQAVPVGEVVTATATNDLTGDTSEFSGAVTVSQS